MAAEDFVGQLKELGYEPELLAPDKVAFPYVIPCGKFADQKIRLGFVIPPDFDLTPPSGPHLTRPVRAHGLALSGQRQSTQLRLGICCGGITSIG